MKKWLSVIAALSLVACEGGVGTTADGAIAVASVASYGEVREISLSDGTKCAVLLGSNKGAISCDWK
jgi:hypothetical protein